MPRSLRNGFWKKKYSDDAKRLRDSFVLGSVEISIPTLMFYETLNALRYSKVYNKNELESAASSLSKYGLDVWEPTGSLYRETARSGVDYNASVYDASYIALSTHLRIPLFTADQEMLEVFPARARHIKTFKQ